MTGSGVYNREGVQHNDKINSLTSKFEHELTRFPPAFCNLNGCKLWEGHREKKKKTKTCFRTSLKKIAVKLASSPSISKFSTCIEHSNQRLLVISSWNFKVLLLNQSWGSLNRLDMSRNKWTFTVILDITIWSFIHVYTHILYHDYITVCTYINVYIYIERERVWLKYTCKMQVSSNTVSLNMMIHIPYGLLGTPTTRIDSNAFTRKGSLADQEWNNQLIQKVTVSAVSFYHRKTNNKHHHSRKHDEQCFVCTYFADLFSKCKNYTYKHYPNHVFHIYYLYIYIGVLLFNRIRNIFYCSTPFIQTIELQLPPSPDGRRGERPGVLLINIPMLLRMQLDKHVLNIEEKTQHNMT